MGNIDQRCEDGNQKERWIELKDEQRKAMFAKKKQPIRKRTRNTGKTAKIGSHGLKVYKGTKVYIGEGTYGGNTRHVFTNMWHTDPSLKKMRKHIKILKITYQKSGDLAGSWDFDGSKVTLIDHGQSQETTMATIVHEIVGHAFWDFSRKWRRDKLVKFNELANSLPPVNDYIKENEEKWKTWNDEQGRTKGITNTKGSESMTRYANEQHSAITELIYEKKGWKKILINDSDKQKLIQAWKELHY